MQNNRRQCTKTGDNAQKVITGDNAQQQVIAGDNAQ